MTLRSQQEEMSTPPSDSQGSQGTSSAMTVERTASGKFRKVDPEGKGTVMSNEEVLKQLQEIEAMRKTLEETQKELGKKTEEPAPEPEQPTKNVVELNRDLDLYLEARRREERRRYGTVSAQGPSENVGHYHASGR